MHWPMGIRGRGVNPWLGGMMAKVGSAGNCRLVAALVIPPKKLLMLVPICLALLTLPALGKDKLTYGEGLIVNIPMPESEVEKIVADVAQNGVIRGTKQYNKDEYVAGAKAATSPRVFPAWDQGGKVFYKVREAAIDPRNFKDSGDVGTLVVRYVVQPQGEKNTILRIDALFQEDFRRTIHQSNGSVESSEYKDIQEHLEAIEVMKQQNVEAETERQEQLAKKRNFALGAEARAQTQPQPAADSSSQGVEDRAPAASQIESTQSEGQTQPEQAVSGQAVTGQAVSGQAIPGQAIPGQTLQEHVQELRKQVERLVKAPGAPLKSAPFHTASTLQSLTAGTEVLILISTPYWYGVETHDGQHGWIMRDQLEQR